MIADDHALISEAIATVLSAQAGFDVTTVNSGHAAFAALNSKTPIDILLLDIGMPGVKGIDSVADFVKLTAPGYVVIFSSLTNNEFVRRAVSMGARGFIPKTTPLGALESILRLIAAGQIYVPMELTLLQAGNTDVGSLSEREESVLEYVAQGKSNKEIAHALAVSEVTIKMVMRTVCKKLAAKNRTEAAMMYRNSI
jgi:two-component system nitrate/nitrite response regulator NarP